MSEEKKLDEKKLEEGKKLDDKALEDVSGGVTYWEAMAYNEFMRNNCFDCALESCAYGDRYNGFYASCFGTCEKRETK